ncbi:MAG: hypothetical protein Q9220_004408 [cf. Caloplaca sp. 1 TL-2023]
MSESSLSSTSPDDAHIEQALRHAVEALYKSDPQQITLKTIRTRVERDLGLDSAFFKSHTTWNARSKDVIQSQVAAQEAQSQPPSSQPAPEVTPQKQNGTRKAARTASGPKRPLESEEAPRKRQKGDRSSSTPLSEVNGNEKKAIASTERAKETINGVANDVSESELSTLIDEEPKPKKRRRKTSEEKPKSRRKENSKPSKATQAVAEPDTEEIKRLQGWLVKCGIRKMWFKELAPYDSPKAKIRHLKDMLAEAGMTGRYSQEKATQIREERELRADLEDVQAGNKQWGKVDSDDDDGGRPRRKVARGLQELDFLKDEDGEETD